MTERDFAARAARMLLNHLGYGRCCDMRCRCLECGVCIFDDPHRADCAWVVLMSEAKRLGL